MTFERASLGFGDFWPAFKESLRLAEFRDNPKRGAAAEQEGKRNYGKEDWRRVAAKRAHSLGRRFFGTISMGDVPAK